MVDQPFALWVDPCGLAATQQRDPVLAAGAHTTLFCSISKEVPASPQTLGTSIFAVIPNFYLLGRLAYFSFLVSILRGISKVTASDAHYMSTPCLDTYGIYPYFTVQNISNSFVTLVKMGINDVPEMQILPLILSIHYR